MENPPHGESPPSPYKLIHFLNLCASLGLGCLIMSCVESFYIIVIMHDMWMCSLQLFVPFSPKLSWWPPWGLGWEVSFHGSTSISHLHVFAWSLGHLEVVKSYLCIEEKNTIAIVLQWRTIPFLLCELIVLKKWFYCFHTYAIKEFVNYLACKGPSLVYLDMMIPPSQCLLDIVLNANFEGTCKKNFIALM